MKLFFSLVLSIALLIIVYTNDTNALTAELISEENNVKVYNILAEPSQESSAVQLRINVTGGTITEVSPGDSEKLSYIATCENNEPFFEQNICMEIAATGGLVETDQVLIKVTVESLPGEDVIFSPNSDHAYLTTNNELITESGVVLDTFPVVTIEEQPAPIIEEAVTNESNSLPFVLLIGILVILVGAFLVIIFFSGKEPKNQIN
jgi:hypothetical protein